MNGFDLDGVISIGIYPNENDVIITGRSFEESEETIKYLKSLGIYNNVFYNSVSFNEKTPENSGIHKAKYINLLGIKRFFEDDEDQIKEIKKRCPDVEIIHIIQNIEPKYNVRRNEKNEIIK